VSKVRRVVAVIGDTASFSTGGAWSVAGLTKVEKENL
jgi:hypothetical protein